MIHQLRFAFSAFELKLSFSGLEWFSSSAEVEILHPFASELPPWAQGVHATDRGWQVSKLLLQLVQLFEKILPDSSGILRKSWV